MENFVGKINLIFDLLLDEQTYKKYGITKQAKYWKMGTSFFTMFDRLLKNIKNLDISFPMVSSVNPYNKTTEGNNTSYQYLLNGINVTPCKVRGYVSDATMHQYMRSICGFGLGVVEKHFKNLTEFVNNKGEIIFVANIKSLLEEKNRMNLIKKVIIDSFFNNIEYQRNISYSILIESLNRFNFDYKNLELENQIFCWNRITGKRNKKEKIVASLVDDLDYIKKDIYNQGTKATYKEIVDCIFKEYKNLEDFINDIWIEYLNKKDNNYEIKSILEKQIQTTNLINKLKNFRSNFKNNIFQDRKNKGLINGINDYYSDIVDYEGNQDSLLSKFNELEAAHIFEINTIKSLILKNEINDEILSYASNPNNGLMMNVEYHKSFDRRQWFFDANGVMIIPEENSQYLLKIRKLKRIKINPKVLNEEMKKFLSKR